jgi:hypothetical protein
MRGGVPGSHIGAAPYDRQRPPARRAGPPNVHRSGPRPNRCHPMARLLPRPVAVEMSRLGHRFAHPFRRPILGLTSMAAASNTSLAHQRRVAGSLGRSNSEWRGRPHRSAIGQPSTRWSQDVATSFSICQTAGGRPLDPPQPPRRKEPSPWNCPSSRAFAPTPA